MPELQRSWLEEFDHTADAGIIVHAGDLPELFARTAWGGPDVRR
jgi:SHS2 domain-containing protein